MSMPPKRRRIPPQAHTPTSDRASLSPWMLPLAVIHLRPSHDIPLGLHSGSGGVPDPRCFLAPGQAP
jgi:hypothetical protein